ncbi:thiol-disulfide oxidoreductase ResA [Oceanobacillus manasiensis]|uniref:thiol-disulfide oxidoreductase ResA n=1 Tax=Oceanobacillus manasiensis TaxID=586413 RepID=UPI0005A95604|nr:thiol-disulfide oxidoreductase ResA [Oceanobacillus manasiensis]
MSLDKVKKTKRNKKRNRFIFRISILAILVVVLIFALVSNLQKDNTIYKVGDQAPDFMLNQISHNNDLESFRLSDYEGKGVMLNFWGTWCEPCKKEMPYMEQLYPEYKEKGVEIIAISLDSTKLVVNRFIDDYNVTFPIPYDASGEVKDLYKIGPIPSTYFINPDGTIEHIVKGALSLESLEKRLQDIQPDAS